MPNEEPLQACSPAEWAQRVDLILKNLRRHYEKAMGIITENVEPGVNYFGHDKAGKNFRQLYTEMRRPLDTPSARVERAREMVRQLWEYRTHTQDLDLTLLEAIQAMCEEIRHETHPD